MTVVAELHYACGVKDLDKVFQVLHLCPSLAEEVNERGEVLLVTAVRNGVLLVVEYLLNVLRVNPCASDKSGETSVMLATKGNRLRILRMLCDKCPDEEINRQNKQGFSAAMIAAQQGYLPALQLLTRATKANLQLVNKLGFDALMLACQRGHSDSVQFLLQNAVIDRDLRNIMGFGRLFVALKANHQMVARALIDSNFVDLAEAVNEKGDSILMQAIAFGHIQMVLFLLQHCEFLAYLRNKQGVSPLQLSVLLNNPQAVHCICCCMDKDNSEHTLMAFEALCEMKINSGYLQRDRDTPQPRGETLLSEEQEQQLQIVSMIVATVCHSQEEAELLAFSNGIKNEFALRALLDIGGGDINHKDDQGGHTILMRVIEDYSFVDAVHVEHLLSLGANVNSRNDYGETALTIAASKHLTAIVSVLCEHGAREWIDHKHANVSQAVDYDINSACGSDLNHKHHHNSLSCKRKHCWI